MKNNKLNVENSVTQNNDTLSSILDNVRISLESNINFNYGIHKFDGMDFLVLSKDEILKVIGQFSNIIVAYDFSDSFFKVYKQNSIGKKDYYVLLHILQSIDYSNFDLFFKVTLPKEFSTPYQSKISNANKSNPPTTYMYINENGYCQLLLEYTQVSQLNSFGNKLYFIGTSVGGGKELCIFDGLNIKKIPYGVPVPLKSLSGHFLLKIIHTNKDKTLTYSLLDLQDMKLIFSQVYEFDYEMVFSNDKFGLIQNEISWYEGKKLLNHSF